MSINPKNFWEFSVTLYAKDGVASACLNLQDTFEIDVNLLLFGCWYGFYFGEFDESTLDQALDFSRIWKTEVVQPLRNVRVWMKANSAKLTTLALEKLWPDAACAGKAYFISNGEPLAMETLLNRILAAADLPPINRYIHPQLAYMGGAILEI